jgi:hypothetical protein
MANPVDIAWGEEWSGATHYRCDDFSPETHAELGHASNMWAFTSACMSVNQLMWSPIQGAWSSVPLAAVSDLWEALPALHWGLDLPPSEYVTRTGSSCFIHGPPCTGAEMLSFRSELEWPQFLEHRDDVFISDGPPQVIPELSAMQGDSAIHMEEESSFSFRIPGPYIASDSEPKGSPLGAPHEEPDILHQTELFSMPSQIEHDSMTVPYQTSSLFDSYSSRTDF